MPNRFCGARESGAAEKVRSAQTKGERAHLWRVARRRAVDMVAQRGGRGGDGGGAHAAEHLRMH